MTASFNHTIIAAKEPAVSAAFFVDLLEAAEVPSWGPFTNLQHTEHEGHSVELLTRPYL